MKRFEITVAFLHAGYMDSRELAEAIETGIAGTTARPVDENRVSTTGNVRTILRISHPTKTSAEILVDLRAGLDPESSVELVALDVTPTPATRPC